jgi:carboxyl-terminal processing protease
MASRTRFLVLVISTPVLAFAVIGGYLGSVMAREETYQHLRVFEDVISLIMNNYVEDPELDKVMEGAMRGLAEGLDPDSAYLTPAEVKTIQANTKPPEGGVGVELTRQYYLRIIAVRDGSPAAKAGLASGDYIRAIDGKPTRDMSVLEGSRLLRGAPGSKVSVVVIRGNAADPHQVELHRAPPAGPEVSGRIVGSEVGYVRVAAFSTGTADQLRARIAELTKAGAARLAIDLRRTAEGPLDAGAAAARLFVSAGTLSIKEGRTAPKETITAKQGDGAIALPVVLVVGSGTSGAAEVFAAALAGNDRAELVGEHTVGRAAVQRLTALPDGSGIWMTRVRYLTPSGAPIHLKGLEPALTVEEPDLEFGAAPPDKDPVLDAAVERLNAKKAA